MAVAMRASPARASALARASAPRNARPVSTIDAEELAAHLRRCASELANTRFGTELVLMETQHSEARESTVIVDVRDTDFQGGNIRGALNVPSEHFYNDAQVDKLVARFAQSRYVVFHCMFSQQRGPFCASKFASRLGAAQLPQEPQVFILERGFSGWLSSGNLDLCENLEGS